MNELYNKELKEAFLSGFENENNRRTRTNVFNHSASIEFLLDKDLFDFNLDEIERLLYKMNASTKNTIKNYCRFIKDYIDWAIKLEYRLDKINPITKIPDFNPDEYGSGPDDWYKKFVIGKKTLFSEQEVKDAENLLVNAQDRVIVRCAFLGISIRELLNLKEEDIYPVSQRLILFDGKRSRTITIDEESMSMIKDALDSEVYYLKNGNSIANKRFDKLAENEYVVRISVGGRSVYVNKADGHIIYKRLSQVAKFDEKYKYFSYRNIINSGRVKWANDHYHRFNGITTEFLNAIAEHFDFEKVKHNNKLEYNIFPMKEYISEEVLDELYPDREMVERL